MTSTTTGSLAMARIRTLVFDVLGTVVDEAGSIAAETAAALAAAGADPGGGQRLAAEWTRRVDDLTGQIGAGQASWRSNDALRGPRCTMLQRPLTWTECPPVPWTTWPWRVTVSGHGRTAPGPCKRWPGLSP
jgi:hypothetical protein